MSTMNYYVVLGIAEDADADEIRTAFRALARRYHPDAGAGASTVEFQRARQAYETLGDPERRRLYDRQLRASRVRPVVIQDRVAWRPGVEPLLGARQVPFGVPIRRVTITRSSSFDDVVEELFEAFSGDGFWSRRWP